MKLFVFCLFFISHTSSGFVEPRSFGEDDSEMLFQLSLLYLTESFGGLSYLAKDNYAPAQMLLGFLIQDSRKTEDFVKEFNDMNLRPKWPIPENPQSLNLLKFWNTPFLSHKKIDELQLSGFFSYSIATLTISFASLNQAKQKSSAIKKLAFQNRFEEHIIRINKKLRTPIEPFPERLAQKCKEIFSSSFITEIKKPPKPNNTVQ